MGKRASHLAIQRVKNVVSKIHLLVYAPPYWVGKPGNRVLTRQDVFVFHISRKELEREGAEEWEKGSFSTSFAHS